MWPFPKKYFEWCEPREFRHILKEVERAQERWWHKPAAGLVVGCLMMASWGLAHFDPNANPIPLEYALTFAYPVGLFLIYLHSGLASIDPSNVMVLDKKLVRTNGRSWREWKFADLDSFIWRDCDDFRVLALIPFQGKQSLIGVGSEIDPGQLEAFFAGRGVKRAVDARVAVAAGWRSRIAVE
jgi:hypothetical protein